MFSVSGVMSDARCTLCVAPLDGPLDEGLDTAVGLEEAVLESAGLLHTHPEDS